jgi:excisionase family DNA binding protein
MSTNYLNTNTIDSIRSNGAQNMSVKEAAIYIGVSERKLRSSIANHEVKHVRFGSRVILRKIDLDSFLEGLVA